ncbi:SCO family protein [Natrarchaeobius halalkaliphilus]|uniref:SCO family protein n=1 Tax=Natrarchaeobius halalkaliphilus TaxID=1679091 RepID=A0A3N6LSY2_9EURY|nr:SCO family protein [Natrarchaeobius halalkaliphilus]RQG91697.1 SCO family protein [Natrarchaeobius halalkaliphilus]
MERRTYLRGLGGVGIGGLAGCLDELGAGDESNPETEHWGDGETILDPPSEERGSTIHPIHGDEFPPFTLPDPLSDESVSLEDFVDERTFLMTYFFTACPDGACPALLLRLRRAQEDAIQEGYEDDIALLAMTFDPERDTPDVLESYAVERSIDYEADNWHFLRPESYEEGETLLDETFGMPIQRVEDPEDHEFEDEHDHGGDEESGDDHGDHDDEDQNGHADHDHGEYTFVHYNLIVLVNDQGVVERAYPNAVEQREEVSIETIVSDARTVAQE